MKLVYEIKEVRDNVICRWYNLSASLCTKIFEDVKRLEAQGKHVKIYLTAKGI